MENISCERTEAHAIAVSKAKENGLKKGELEKLCAIFRILAEPSRMKIVLALMQGGMCVYHLAEVTEGSVSAVSHQLKLLREEKIVKSTRLGKYMEYAIADGHVLNILQTAMKHLDCTVEG